ncbi:hypothetical protein EXW28_07710 [Bacillus mycoides]|uniref:hypothetical protein n=1 Tax=Bacillus mycoides TaxID=1405 RepID=UPI001C03369A|nr:hypothetical protein [Bacillus mycoides]QWG49749.1 hypothetical protein EXW37_07710 [Bacillus mycoides]QWH33554.1 hypothetical protein EXW28_07710 [Bacillus mycoides]
MTNSKYTKEALYKATGIVKRTLINQFRKGIRSKITKTETFNMIYPKVNLSSRRALWNSPYIDYLNEWYSKLQNELNQLKEGDTYVLRDSLYNKVGTTEDLIAILTQKERYITLLEERIKNLSSENEDLRAAYNGKYTTIDLEK